MSATRLLLLLVLAQCGCSLSSQAITNTQSPETVSQKLPPLGAKSCEPAKDENELPQDRFARKGGREIKANVVMDGDALTAADIAQGRDLTNYERLKLKNPRVSLELSSAMQQARSFVWEHWRDKKPAYLIFTGSSVDATSTSHVFIEQDQTGKWRVAWRIVRHDGSINDLPIYYAVEWVRPGGWRQPGVPLSDGEKPDPKKHQLEFRDVCGDVEQSF